MSFAVRLLLFGALCTIPLLWRIVYLHSDAFDDEIASDDASPKAEGDITPSDIGVYLSTAVAIVCIFWGTIGFVFESTNVAGPS